MTRLLPGLAGRNEHHLIELEEVSDLTGRDQVTVVDGIEGPTHHAESAPNRHDGRAYF